MKVELFTYACESRGEEEPQFYVLVLHEVVTSLAVFSQELGGTLLHDLRWDRNAPKTKDMGAVGRLPNRAV